jgi:fluoride exporter
MARGSRVPVKVVAAVAAGGALGTLARYLISVGLPTEPGRFPWATFLTNLSGTLLL